METISVDSFDAQGRLLSARSVKVYTALIRQSFFHPLGGDKRKLNILTEGTFLSYPGIGAVIRPSMVPNAEYIFAAPDGFETLLRERITEETGKTLEECTIQEFFDAIEAQCEETPATQWDTFAQNATGDDNRQYLNGAFNEDTVATVTTADGDSYPGVMQPMTEQTNMPGFFRWIESCLPEGLLALPTSRIMSDLNPSSLNFSIYVDGCTGIYKFYFGSTCDIKFDVRL